MNGGLLGDPRVPRPGARAFAGAGAPLSDGCTCSGHTGCSPQPTLMFDDRTPQAQTEARTEAAIAMLRMGFLLRISQRGHATAMPFRGDSQFAAAFTAHDGATEEKWRSHPQQARPSAAVVPAK